MSRTWTAYPILLLLGFLIVLPGRGFQTPRKSDASQSDAAGVAARNYFGDTVLVDQNGTGRKFYTDLLRGKIVIINSFFTTCPDVCPMMLHKLEEIQSALGDRVGKDIFIVSISVDPAVDTPARIREFVKPFHPRAGWSFLTGDRENVEQVLRKLGMSVEDKQDHSTLLLVGNEPTGYWKKLLSLASANDLVRSIEDVAKN
jgi:protein SCO1/2